MKVKTKSAKAKSAESCQKSTLTPGLPLASVSMDLDNQWSYMKTRGDVAWQCYPSYLGTLVPRTLDLLDRLELDITFFIVGQDAVLRRNGDFLAEITGRGHEVGNHSFHHEQWLHRYSKGQLMEEIARAHEAVLEATGQEPTGFRGPGYCCSPLLLEVLAKRGYIYDASTFPTYIGPLSRMYFFRNARLSREERVERAQLFGTLADGRRPLTPYNWELGFGATLLEIPVTTCPVLRIPWHMSYLLYLSNFSFNLMLVYLKFVVMMCKITRTEPSFLLHPVDLIGGEEVPELASFPSMDIPKERKIILFERIIRELKKNFSIVKMSSHAACSLSRPDLPSITVGRF